MQVGDELHYWTCDENGEIAGYPGEPCWTESSPSVMTRLKIAIMQAQYLAINTELLKPERRAELGFKVYKMLDDVERELFPRPDNIDAQAP